MGDSSDLVGKVLGAYTLERLVGRGGMSAVYLARQARPSRYVAIKVLLPNIARGSKIHNEFLLRFQQEADVVAKLEHANIIPIYDYDEQDKLAYLVMPYLSGGSLDDLLTQRGILSLSETSRYIDQAAAALEHAHAYGVIHRDLKPSNFLLYADGRLVLADFGIARMMQGRNNPQGFTLTLTGTILGTPEYMAPEMALGRPIDARTDIYELGIVIFQMLNGDIPFKGSTSFELIGQHLQMPLPSLHQLNPTIPEAVDDVLQKATAKRPEDRYTRAGALADALRVAITSDNSPYAPTILSAAPAVPPPVWDVTPPTAVPPQQVIHRKPPTYAPIMHTPPVRANRPSWLTVGIFLAFVLLILSGGLAALRLTGTPQAHLQQIVVPTPTQQTQQAQEAQQVVGQFYSDLNHRDYQSAFSLFETSLTLCSFADDFSHTLSYNTTFERVKQFPDRSIQVGIILNTVENIKAGKVARVYKGYQIVRKINNTWKIVGGALPQFGPTNILTLTSTPSILPGATTSQQAQSVIQQYHDNLSHQDYNGAYNLWGSAYQNSTTYCQFLLDHVKILHDDITFDGVTSLTDSTTQVSTTIHETKEINSNPATSVSQERYVVGLENNTWKILSEVAL